MEAVASEECRFGCGSSVDEARGELTGEVVERHVHVLGSDGTRVGAGDDASEV